MNKIEHTKLKIRYNRAKINIKMLLKATKRNNRRKRLEVEAAHLIRDIDKYVNDEFPYFELAAYGVLDIEKLENMNV